ncbi:protein YebF [Ewingella americana]|uniref:protein YebF n=1 Tax=Ewingella americana TaxID=41202 RepID=UPI001F29BE7C|nr:protein YebF [Ewingella americana]
MVGNKSKVVLIGLISAVFIIMVVMLGTVYLYPMWMQRTTPEACKDITPQNAIDTVTRDFMQNRIPNWGNDKDYIGTAVPVLSFVSDNVKDEKGTYRVPFTAKGASGELKYVGHFNCTNHYIKYESVD